jgi:hypothetical protein
VRSAEFTVALYESLCEIAFAKDFIVDFFADI